MASKLESWAKSWNTTLGIVSNWGRWLACAFLAIIVLGNGYEVITRFVFRHPTGIMIDIMVYANICLVFIGLAWAWRSNRHVVIEVGIEKLPGRWRAVFDSIASMITLATLVVLAYTVWWQEIQFIIQMRKPESELPLPWFVPMLMVCLGVTFFAMEMLATVIKNVRSFFIGKPQ